MKQQIITTLLLLLIVSVKAQQKTPTAFANLYDSITYVATPGSPTLKQVIVQGKTTSVSLAVPAGKWHIAAYTAQDQTPVSNYIHFAAFTKDSVDSSTNPNVSLTMQVTSYIVLIPKSAMGTKIPIIRVYQNNKQSLQELFILSGSYYVKYLRRTKIDQVFKVDIEGSGDQSKMYVMEPVPNQVMIINPATKSITVNLVDPTK